MTEMESTSAPVVETPVLAAPAIEPRVVQSPPAAPTKAHIDDGPRLRLNQVAAALSHGLNRQLLAEYLQLRRACRQ